MESKIGALSGRQVVVALLLILAFIIPTTGCATSYLKTYLPASNGANGSTYMVEWKIEHNFLNSKYQKVDREGLEDDLAG